eukprot:125251_1
MADEKEVEKKEMEYEKGGKVFIQKLNVHAAATTVKADTSPTWLKVAKVVAAFLILYLFYAGLYALCLFLTVKTGATVLYVYFAIFVVFTLSLAFAVMYGMRVRAEKDRMGSTNVELEQRKMMMSEQIMEKRMSVSHHDLKRDTTVQFK